MKTQITKFFFVALVMTFAFANSAKAQDIVDLAAGNENLSTLVAAVKAGGLVDVLKSDGPFTVFALLMMLLLHCLQVRWSHC